LDFGGDEEIKKRHTANASFSYFPLQDWFDDITDWNSRLLLTSLFWGEVQWQMYLKWSIRVMG
jgi:hypothetical protein